MSSNTLTIYTVYIVLQSVSAHKMLVYCVRFNGHLGHQMILFVCSMSYLADEHQNRRQSAIGCEMRAHPADDSYQSGLVNSYL